MSDVQKTTDCAECGERPGYHRGNCPTGRAIYDNLKATLGGAVPCYGEPGGCHMDDRHDCEAGCLLLAVYRAGETRGRAQGRARQMASDVQKGTPSNVVLHPITRLLRTPGLTSETLRAIRRDIGLDRQHAPPEQPSLGIEEPKQ